MKRYLSIAVIVLGLSFPAAAQDANARPAITVSGQAEVMVAPDEVVFRLEVENINLDLNLAKAQTDDEVKKVFALARNYQIAPQNVQTSYISVAKRYSEVFQNKPREFKGYAVSQRIVILLKDISRFDALLSEIVKAGISNVSGVSFRASQMRKYMDQARALAMRAAREKAIALAGEIGQRIGKANTIAELSMSVSSAYEDEDDNQRSNNYSNTLADMGSNIADNEGTIAPGMISVIARVKVSFDLN